MTDYFHPAQIDQRPFRLGDWCVDPKSREITSNGRRRRLSPRAMSALLLLVEADGEVVLREQFFDKIWPDVTVCDESLTTVAAELRRAFDDKSSENRLFLTVPKTGYRLSQGVYREHDDESHGAVDSGFSLEAYTLSIDASRLCDSGEKGSVLLAEEACKEAVRIAPNFALAQAHYAITTIFSILFAGGKSHLSIACTAATKALELRPDLSICHAAKGYVEFAVGKYDAARLSFGRAINQDPNDIDANAVAYCALFGIGDWRSTATLAERAAVTQPDDYFSLAIAARAAEALDDCHRATNLAIRSHTRAANQLFAGPTQTRTRYVSSCLSAMLGDHDEAIRILNSCSQAEPAYDYYAALTLARVGAVSEALERIESIVDNGWRHGRYLTIEPFFAGLQNEARLKKTISKLH